MRTPRIFVAYSPRAGLRCAVAYLASGRDAYGWFTGPAEDGVRSGYFVLEEYYTPLPTRRVIVEEDQLYGGAIDDARCHELARLADFMEHEWLFHRGDPHAAAQLRACAEAELAVGEIAVRFERLNRLAKLHMPWTYYSPGFEQGVLECLAARWALDYRPAAIAQSA